MDVGGGVNFLFPGAHNPNPLPANTTGDLQGIANFVGKHFVSGL